MGEASLIQIEDSTLSFGDESIDLTDCTADGLIDVFGEPDEIEVVEEDPRYQILTFHFQMHVIRAYVRFEPPAMYFTTACIECPSVVDEGEGLISEEDRGILTELHVDLWESARFKTESQEQEFFFIGAEKFAIFGLHFIGRICDENALDYLVFINHKLIQIQNSFFIKQGQRFESREANFFALQEVARAIKKDERRELSLNDITSMAEKRIAEVLNKDNEPTKG